MPLTIFTDPQSTNHKGNVSNVFTTPFHVASRNAWIRFRPEGWVTAKLIAPHEIVFEEAPVM